ncbi:MAG TPA: glycosyltransferase family A protein [Solirubrobacteraceae bacterium]|nr:glycosyltransferase family A protein [Solirubrobacteraceae bacterium]
MSAPGASGQLVSVIVPAYEAQEYLEEALRSALAQDHGEVEIVVVDDGSTDRTAEIALACGVRVLRQRNAGPAAARNAGLAVARGAFVTILDADDVWPADRLSSQLAYLREHPEVGIVMGLTEVFLTPGQERPAHDPRFAEGEQVTGHPATMLVRREVFELVGGFDESLRLSEDIDWLARAGDAGVRSGRVDRTLLRYRIHAGNNSRDTQANHAATLSVLRASVARKRSRIGV